MYSICVEMYITLGMYKYAVCVFVHLCIYERKRQRYIYVKLLSRLERYTLAVCPTQATNLHVDPLNKLLFDLYWEPFCYTIILQACILSDKIDEYKNKGLHCHLHLLIKCQQLKTAGSIIADTENKDRVLAISSNGLFY